MMKAPQFNRPTITDRIMQDALQRMAVYDRRARYDAVLEAIFEIRRTPLGEAQLRTEIDAIAGWCDSSKRLYYLLFLLWVAKVDRDLFWQVMTDWWSACDDTWRNRNRLLRLMRKHRPAPPQPELPDKMIAYRGAARARVRGVSWTLDEEVARKIRYGHRLFTEPHPVIATARIRREAVFLHITDRDEDEILLDPRRLPWRIDVSDYKT